MIENLELEPFVPLIVDTHNHARSVIWYRQSVYEQSTQKLLPRASNRNAFIYQKIILLNEKSNFVMINTVAYIYDICMHKLFYF